MKKVKIIVTCEHGGNKIPKEYLHLFVKHKNLLSTHLGYDIGILSFARRLGNEISDFVKYSEITRLLIELNRSLRHKNLFSFITKELSNLEKHKLIKYYYLPYRNEVENRIKKYIASGYFIIHLSVHSFTPVLKGKTRNCDIGLLYDPKRQREKSFCNIIKANINSHNNKLRVRFNYPYRGIADGFISYLRKKFSPDKYLGIEIEINQKYSLGSGEKWKLFQHDLSKVLEKSIKIITS